jgi:glycosyltransferase involved in cell wall biosynthesis
MLELYRTQSRRLEVLRKYNAVITHSEFMREEYIRHGVSAARAFSFPYLVEPLRSQSARREPAVNKTPETNSVWRLVFAGRMDRMKGGLLLLQALPLVRSASGRAIELVFAGDGPDRHAWEAAAAALKQSDPGISIEFAGWRRESELGALFHAAHLLVVPSIWPEPLGIVGIQAASESVPAAAFDVGGISKWLIDGVSGHLASADPPTAAGLAAAIVKCLSNDVHYAELCEGAARTRERFSLHAHLCGLMQILEAVVGQAR